MNDTEFANAMTLHQEGRTGEAAALYRTILNRDPDHADSLHLLGLITVEQAGPQAVAQGKHRAYGDQEYVQALQAFLTQAMTDHAVSMQTPVDPRIGATFLTPA
jgi:thioredoxin-like negative regulator of GroEL